MVPTDLSPIQGNNAITPTLWSPGVYESHDFVFEEVDESFRPLKLVSNLPFCQVEDGLLAQGMARDPSKYLDFLLCATLRLWHPICAICTAHGY